MTLYFLGEPIEVHGSCDDGWVWGEWTDEKEREKAAWFWAVQLHESPFPS